MMTKTSEVKTKLKPEEFRGKLKKYRLNESEYGLICQLLKREPFDIEWALFSALWSEHCSYKSSKIHLRKFCYHNEMTRPLGKTTDEENAGIVNIGQGEKIIFKMESHNHPSFIEPFHGAATGVGGILRDIFTMGARPIALANSLFFGELKAERMPELFKGVVHGISSYGNCVGVPMLTGKTQFHPKYNKNILVNAMAVGYLNSKMKLALSQPKGPGNFVVYVGAKTGADGVHGASMASESFEKDSESKRPNIQIGDPFFEKLLIEACLETIDLDLVVAIQDMGAAGLTSSSFEMAAKGNVGLTLNLDLVPLRNSDLTPEDILLSESQERMLLICEPGKFEKLKNIFLHWGLEATVLGEVQTERKVVLKWKGEVLTEIDPWLLTENAPRYERSFAPWKSNLKASFVDSPAELSMQKVEFEKYQPREIYERYDQRVGGRTARGCDQSVGFVRLPDSGRGLAMALGGRCYLLEKDAQFGSVDAAYFPILQMATKGARPLAMTDCLNFGNPEKSEIMSEFVASVEAICEVSKKFDAPVISGNVSFYNETLGENIVPTPSLGLVGLRKDVQDIPYDAVSDLPAQNFSKLVVLSYLGLQIDKSLNIFGQNNLENLFRFAQHVREISNDLQPMVMKAIGYQELQQEWQKVLGSQGLSILKEKAGLTSSGTRPLYQVLTLLTEAQFKQFQTMKSNFKDIFEINEFDWKN